MIEHAVVVLGMLGTGLLALDIVRPQLLRLINLHFIMVSRLKFSFRIFWKPNDQLTKGERRVIKAIIKLSGYTFALLLLFSYPFLSWDYQLSNYVKFGILALLALPVLAGSLVHVANDVSVFLVRVINAVSVPGLALYFYFFLFVGVVYQLVIRRVFSVQRAYLARHQAPRFLGLVLLFCSFFLQLF